MGYKVHVDGQEDGVFTRHKYDLVSVMQLLGF